MESSSYSNDKSSAFSKVLFAIKKYSGLFINKYGMTALEAPPAPNSSFNIWTGCDIIPDMEYFYKAVYK